MFLNAVMVYTVYEHNIIDNYFDMHLNTDKQMTRKTMTTVCYLVLCSAASGKTYLIDKIMI